MKRKKLMVVLIILLVLIFSTLVLFSYGYIVLNNLVFIREAQYKVEVEGEPKIYGRLYLLNVDKEYYLLVLNKRSCSSNDGYFIKLKEKEIGLPNFSKYIPLVGGALINKSIKEGYPHLGKIEASFVNNGDKTEIYIKGLWSETNKTESPTPDSSKLLGYHRQIILKKENS